VTREQAREAAAVMLAWADGKEVEFKLNQGSLWTTSSTNQELGFDWSVFTYRIKPTAKLRAWTADEVPLGAWMRVKDSNCGHRRVLICGTYDELTRSTWLSTSEHSLDGGKTWKPCGVMEEAK
jgi:hypothetical protein